MGKLTCLPTKYNVMNMKKILVFILSGIIFISGLNIFCFADEPLLISPAPDTTQASFNDVIKGSQLDMILTKLKNAGIINGYEDGSFRPYGNLTRAEFCTMYNRILGREGAVLIDAEGKEITAETYGFTDLDAEKWYYKDMLRATSAYDENGCVDVAKRGIRNNLDDYGN